MAGLSTTKNVTGDVIIKISDEGRPYAVQLMGGV